RAILGDDLLSLPQDALKKRFQIVPEFGPVLTGRLAEGAGMLVADCRSVGIVVEGYEFGPPEHHDLGARSEQKIDGKAQAVRPVRHWPQPRVRPVMGGYQISHPVAARQP